MSERPLNVLVLYDAYSTYTQTVVEHLRSFRVHSGNRVWYAHGVRGAQPLVDLAAFDAVIVHYSVRLITEHLISAPWAAALTSFAGAKLLFIQDEYDATETARRWIERLGFDVVFTCVPEPFVGAVYPPSRFPKTRFVPTLTGFVPRPFETTFVRKPIRERPLAIVYRGRPLPYWYGRLGREKLEIGVRMKRVCAERGVPADIEWSEEARIYGERWYDFLQSGKATLGTESGANVFDEDGRIRASIEAALREQPDLSFEDAWERFVKPHEGRVRMNQISPKVFESIALGTVLILYEGEYSGVVKPWEHFIPLKKDLSNVDEVLAALRDDARLQEMADRAWADVIGSGRWGYRAAVEGYDRALREAVAAKAWSAPREPFLVMVGTQSPEVADTRPVKIGPRHRLRDLVTTAPLLQQHLFVDLGNAPLWLRAARRVWARLRLGRILQRLRGW